MKLTPRNTHRATLSRVRETPENAERLAAVAHAHGLTVPEALRQLVSGYVARPFDLSRLPVARRGLTSRLCGPVAMDAELLKAFGEWAKLYNLTVGEGVRRVVRRYLARQQR